MRHPNLSNLKLRVLLQLDSDGPQKLDGSIWSALQDLQADYPEHYLRFRDLAVAELEREGAVVVSSDMVFLRAPISEIRQAVEIDLETAMELLTAFSIANTEPPSNPLKLCGSDLLRLSGQLIRRVQELEAELKDYRSRDYFRDQHQRKHKVKVP